MRPIVTWQAYDRVDVTASLPAAHPYADNLGEHLASCAAARRGATLSGPHLGIWQGEHEMAYTLTRVGNCHAWTREAVAAAHRAGCEAVQVETWGSRAGRSGYCVEEWRPGE